MTDLQGELIYLACPYTDPDPAVKHGRFIAANRAAGRLMEKGLFVFSPISHSHPIAIIGNLPASWKYWEAYDRAMLSRCSKLVVLCLDGWKESVGVQAEINIAKEMELMVEYIVEIESP